MNFWNKMNNRDFTIKKYKELLIALKENEYKTIIPYESSYSWCQNEGKKFLILRHDIDKNCKIVVEFAKLEKKYNFRGIYYFRKINDQFDANTIKIVSALQHEIGYHYEALTKTKGNVEKAIEIFSNELKELREIVPVHTICMHGAPLKKWDNRRLWKKYNYHDFDIQFEPYFDVDFNQVFYLTDTGRHWNGKKTNLRDRANMNLEFRFKSTADIIHAMNNDELAHKLMINCHPHRWNDKYLPWLKELIWQNIKNLGKIILIKIRK